jgi:type IV secretory pathway VirB2 component (pilin)
MGEMTGLTNRAERSGREANDSDWLDYAVRAGLVAYGIVHLMIAWLALQLAFGEQEGKATSSGALQQLVREPFGEILVWLIAVGMFLLVLWRLIEAVAGHEEEDGAKKVRKRLTSLGKAIIYGALAVSAVRVATGSSSQGGGSDSTTAQLMDLPAGRWIVAGVGLAIIAYGANLVRRAWTEKFREHLSAEGKSGDAGKAYIWFGKAGYMAKGISIAIVGGLFCYAAVTHDPKKSGGLDQALQTVLEQPFGQVLLTAIAIGIIAYGLFCFVRAKHLSRASSR